MKNELTIVEVKECLNAVGAEMQEDSQILGDLDGVLGDGDMGVTINIAFRALGKFLKKTRITSIGELLCEIGEFLGEEAPSTYGTLLAAMMKGAGQTVGDAEVIDTGMGAALLEGAAEAVMARGGAKLGDKTLLDALIPACEAAKKLAAEGKELYESAPLVAEAAEMGAENTINLKARTGRAAYMGDRTVGVKDPGAAATAMILRAISNYLTV